MSGPAFQKLATVSEDAFFDIIQELEARPLPVNQYRLKAGVGRSAAFGFVNRRCLEPDLSRLCWQRPYLYHLLLDFGRKHVPFTDWNAITVNQNYATAPHRDKGNAGISYLVAFGNFQGGQLKIHEGDCSGGHDIRHQPVLFDGAKILHSVSAFEGERYSLVYYKLSRQTSKRLEQYEPVQLPKGWVLEYTGAEGKTSILKRNNGLPHPLTGRRKLASPAAEV
jgi:hypothetical protein